MINFRKMEGADIPLYLKWAEEPEVKNTWFIDGYETTDYIHAKIKGNGYDYPFIILLNQKPIGYIVYSDLYLYKTLSPQPKGNFTDEPEGTFCIDLFIGTPEYRDKGLGTKIVEAFSKMLFEETQVKRILIDPDASNKRAIRCYEKAGFKFLKFANDGVTKCQVMELRSPSSTR